GTSITADTSVNISVTDDSGNTTDIKIYVLVSDTTRPDITSVLTDQIVSSDANCQFILADYASSLTATDNCDTDLTIVQSPPAGTVLSGVGNLVTISVTDDAGNVAEESFTVSAIDNTDPVITSTHGDQSVVLDLNCQAQLPDYTSELVATDNCDASLSIVQSPVTGTAISGSTNLVTLTVSDNAGLTAEVSFNVSVTDPGPPVISSNPGTEYYAIENDNASLNVVVDGSITGYQWFKNGTAIADGGVYSGATTSVLNLTGLSSADTGSYHCVVSGICDYSVTSNSVKMFVSQQPVIATHPSAPGPQCEGTSSFTIDLIATGSNITYQWKKDGTDLTDDARISGSNTASLTINDLTLSDAGSYSCLVSADEGIENSYPVNLIIQQAATITIQPFDVYVCEDESATISIEASGANLSYQWRKDGVALTDDTQISGTATKTLIITSVASENEGLYSCNVTGTCGSVLSNPVNLTVQQLTGITSQPTSKSVCEGENTSFTVAASGSNVSYQWMFNGTDISGATSSTYLIAGVDQTVVGNYSVEITGSCGSVISDLATLTLPSNTSITLQPTDVTYCTGGQATISIEASGANLSYQWRKDGVALTDDTQISGTATKTLIITSVASENEGLYSCNVTGTCGSVLSNPANLTVQQLTGITTQLTSKSVCEGENTSFTVAASGSNVSYQWMFNGTDISGANSSTYTIAGVDQTDAGNYSIEITGSCGSVISDLASLTVLSEVAISSHPTSQTISENDSLSFEVLAIGSGLSYQWKKDGVDIAGATSNRYTIQNAILSDAGNYTCVITGDCNEVTSNVATLVVNSLVVITSQPLSQVECEGGNVSLSVTATGENLTFEWRKDDITMVNEAGKIDGAHSSALTLSSLSNIDAGSYTCVVTGSGSSVVSNAATIEIISSTVINTQPASQEVLEGETVSFSLEATGTDLSYQWMKDNDPIGGATSSIFTLLSVSKLHEGNYTCAVTGTCGAVSTNAATLVVNALVTISTQPVSQDICEGGSASFSVIATGDNLTYEWMKDNIAMVNDTGKVEGAHSSTLTVSLLTSSDAGSYTCVVAGSGSSLTSDAATLDVISSTVITLQPVSQEVDEGSTVSFIVEATGADLTYQWKKDNVSISGETGTNITLLNATNVDEGTYNCEIIGSCGTMTSNPAILIVNTVTGITSQPTDQSSCEGENLTFTITATGENLTYEWRKDGTALTDIVDRISGVSTSTLQISNLTIADAGLYSCVVSGSGGSLISASAVLEVSPVTEIVVHPEDASAVCMGDQVTFSVEGSGADLSYEWRHDGSTLADDGSHISGSNSNSLTISQVVQSDSGDYECLVSGTCSNMLTNTARLSMNSPEITSLHEDQIVYADLLCKAVLSDYTGSLTASDPCDDALIVEQKPLPGTNIAGALNTITLTVTNNAGIASALTFNVAVMDTLDPRIICLDDSFIDAVGTDSIVISGIDYDPVIFADNCMLSTITNDQNNQSSLNGVTLPIGENVITWTVIDNSGNEASCTTVITVKSGDFVLTFEESGITLYPNPTSGEVSIAFPDIKNREITVTDVLGKELLIISNSEPLVTFDLSEYKSGLYFICIRDNERTVTGRIIKK
ncbi:immunoglobulin domain-containing protein, partial [Bacteroidota bacterium]